MSMFDAALTIVIVAAYLILAVLGVLVFHATVNHLSKRAGGRAADGTACTSPPDDARVTPRAHQLPGQCPGPGERPFVGPLDDWQRCR
jgi:hypothetical protein